MVSLVMSLRKSAFEPIFTGALLFLFIKGPEPWRARLQTLFSYPLPFTGYVQTLVTPSTVIKGLLGLFALGAVRRVNSVLNKWALGHWQFRKPGVPWDFDTIRKTEIAVVTGGCSGIGLLTVKALAGSLRVVVLDIQDMPVELKACELIAVSV
jgi:all-trans-retinol dehydrogenase (NAD+)